MINTDIDPDDGNACTTDSCDPTLGVLNLDISPNDNNACTIDACDPATGVSNTEIDPDDGVDCTIDSCDPATGVSNLPLNSLCSNDVFCDGEEICNPTLGCQEGPGDPCTDQTSTACTLPDTCNEDLDQCDLNNIACGGVTNSALCTFDVSTKGVCVENNEPTGQACDPTLGLGCTVGHCIEENQFRLLFTPSGASFKLSGKNPGQYYYNAREMKECTPGEPEEFVIHVPYPFVTHGARPVHVYDGALVGEGMALDTIGNDQSCFLPPEESLAALPALIRLEDWKTGATTNGDGWTVDCEPTYVESPPASGRFVPQPPSECTITVYARYPESCELYVNVHLDLVVAGPQTDANPIDGQADQYTRGGKASPWGTYDAMYPGTNLVAIEDCQDLSFSHQTGLSSFADVVQNLNEFKKVAGVYGCLTDGVDNPLPDQDIVLKLGSSTVDSATTDADGCYLINYKHKGKAASYTVDYNGETTNVILKGNGSAEANYKSGAGWTTP